jgi:hypothetical protein
LTPVYVTVPKTWVVPFMNCTVLEGAKPRLVVHTSAVRVTGAPELTVVWLAEMLVAVAALVTLIAAVPWLVV